MKYSKKLGDLILKRLKERGSPQKCPLCGTGDWQLTDGFYFLSVQQDFPSITPSNRGMPLAALVCKNCGNTHLINLLQIGLGDIFTKKQ